MKRIIFALLVFATSRSLGALSTDPNLRWNLGTFDVCWNHFSQTSSNKWSMDNTLISLVDLEVYFGSNDFGFETSIFQSRKNRDVTPIVTMLPISLYVNLTHWGPLFLGSFAKGEIDSYGIDMKSYFEGGIRIYDFIQDDPNRWNYSWKNSIYVSYDSHGQLNIGTQFDVASFFLIIIALQSASSKERQQPNI